MSQNLTNIAQIDYQYILDNDIVTASAQTNYVTTNIIGPNLTVLLTSSASHFAPGDRIIYSIFVSNTTLSTAYDVSISDPLTDALTYVKGSSTITYCDGISRSVPESDSPSDPNRPIVGNIVLENCSTVPQFGFKVGNICPNETVILSFAADVTSVNAPDTIVTQATAFYSTNSIDSCRRVSVLSNQNTITKAFALIAAEKTVDKSSAYCGDTLRYTITLTNAGNVDAANVRIFDALPQGFELQCIKFKIADLPYKISYHVDENNNLTIPATSQEEGFSIPANTDDNFIHIIGTISCDDPC